MLAGKVVLIVESEFLIALSMQAALQGQGVTQFLVLTDHREALQLADKWHDVDLAIVEIEARRTDQLRLLTAIAASGIPVLGVTADSRLKNAVPEVSDTALLVKPVLDEDLVEAANALMQQAPV